VFSIELLTNGQLRLQGRLDANQSDFAQQQLERFPEVDHFDLSQLDYISSAGLGLLVKVHKTLMDSDKRLKLSHLSTSIRDIMRYSGLDQLFEIQG
jgi:anti-sigma B factor antagonist